MAHFSVSCNSIASLFIFLSLGFEQCNNNYLAAFVLPGPAMSYRELYINYKENKTT